MDKIIKTLNFIKLISWASVIAFFAIIISGLVVLATPFYCLYLFGKAMMQLLGVIIFFFISIIIEIKQRWLGGL